MFSVFALIAVIFSLLAICGVVALVYIQVEKNTLKVGDLVRTTFTGSPAVLTTALWGTGGEYGFPGVYGTNYSVDAANALHCDMPGGTGIFSTWISDAGMNYKINPSYSNTPLYIFGNQCQTPSDCSLTSLKCGPGWPTQDQSSWNGTNTKKQRPDFSQCPQKSFCSLCKTPWVADTPNYCQITDPNAVGNCLSTEEVDWQCLQLYPGLNPPVPQVCAANQPVTQATPSHKRFESCSLDQNYINLEYVDPRTNPPLTASCNDPTFASVHPYFCDLPGNVQCMTGQECVANWGNGSETGWKVTGGAVDPYYQTASYVCSGTVFPMITMQTDWIAEGKISSISGTRYYVDWNRIQNTYGGVGPSANQCNSSSGSLRCYQPTEDNPFDNSWIYSDCRFVKMDDPVPSRHLSVSNALLGSTNFAPLGLDIFSVTDTSFTRNVLSLLHVATQTQGAVANVFTNTSVPIPYAVEYRPTAWNLSNVYRKEALERIFFFSIHPMQASDETDGWAENNFSVVRNNLMNSIRPKP